MTLPVPKGRTMKRHLLWASVIGVLVAYLSGCAVTATESVASAYAHAGTSEGLLGSIGGFHARRAHEVRD